ncbi:MAG TPA: M48 family metalloprotease [bacterium]|nr:M48 family metalloprotease [bacterium]
MAEKGAMSGGMSGRGHLTRWIAVTLTVVAAAAPLGFPGGGLPAVDALTFPSTADEVKFGAQVAKSIESQFRLITDPAQVGRLQRVGDALTRVVERQDLTYHFKIVSVPGINALSIPGGWVYVTEGMMRFVRSDDELAAVLAHELTHVNHRHYYIQADREKRMTPALLVALVLSVLAHSPVPLLGAQISLQAVMNDYQRDLEHEADLNGVTYLTKAGYSPVAMLTLIEHLAQESRFNGQPVTGLEDHPLPQERVDYIRADLQSRRIPIVRRPVEGYLKISLEPPQPAPGAPVTIRVDGQPIATFGAAVAGASAADRALALAVRLDMFFNRDPEPFDVRAVAAGGTWNVVGGEMPLFEVTPQDAAFAQTSAQAMAEEMRARLARVISAAPYVRKF